MSSQGSSGQTASRNTLFAILALVVIISPWPLGSNRDWFWPVVPMICCPVAVFCLWLYEEPVKKHFRITTLAFTLLITWMCWQHFGIPGVHQPISINYYDSQNEILKTAGLFAFFYACVALLHSHHRMTTLLYFLVFVGTAQAILGATQQLLFDVPRASGSFPNPNHYAGYLEVTLALSIGLMIALHQPNERVSFLTLITGQLGRLRLLIIIMVIALVMSRSRMGNIAFFTGILIAAAITFFYSRHMSRFTATLLASILLLDLLIIGNFFGLERLEERLRDTTSMVGRVELQSYNRALFADHWLVGTGAGTYSSAFPPYRDEALPRKATHAESDYVEFLIELGVVGCLPLIVLILASLHAQLKLLGTMAHPFARGIAFGCLAATISILIHGIADVNLQIPSNALLFVLTLALPIALLHRADLHRTQVTT